MKRGRSHGGRPLRRIAARSGSGQVAVLLVRGLRSGSGQVAVLLVGGLRHGSGQVAVLLVGGLLAVVVGALILGAVARGMGIADGAQRAADLSALAGARAMHDAYPRLFEPAVVNRRPNPRHLEKDAYLALGRTMAARVAAANGAPSPAIVFPDAATIAPVRVRVIVHRRIELAGEGVRVTADAEADLAPAGGTGPSAFGAGGGYDGPLAYRQGKPMRPDVAQAFDRMAAAARRDGIDLIVTSGFRSDDEQAILFARHPDPKWVAPPGESLHRNATELDLGPKSAYGWLAAHAGRFHFLQRYPWEPWHYGTPLAHNHCRDPGNPKTRINTTFSPTGQAQIARELRNPGPGGARNSPGSSEADSRYWLESGRDEGARADARSSSLAVARNTAAETTASRRKR